MVDALKNSTGADFAVLTSGNIRAALDEGQRNFGDIFKVVPFDNLVCVIHATGAEIKGLLTATEKIKAHYGSVSGLKLKLQSVEIDGTEINAGGAILDIKKSNGEPILDKEPYKLATIDFLANGGDGWAPTMKNINKDRIDCSNKGTLLDIFEAYIVSTFGSRQSWENSKIDPQAEPRAEMVDPLK